MLHITFKSDYVADGKNNIAEFCSMKYTAINESISKVRPTKNVTICKHTQHVCVHSR